MKKQKGKQQSAEFSLMCDFMHSFKKDLLAALHKQYVGKGPSGILKPIIGVEGDPAADLDGPAFDLMYRQAVYHDYMQLFLHEEFLNGPTADDLAFWQHEWTLSERGRAFAEWAKPQVKAGMPDVVGMIGLIEAYNSATTAVAPEGDKAVATG